MSTVLSGAGLTFTAFLKRENSRQNQREIKHCFLPISPICHLGPSHLKLWVGYLGIVMLISSVTCTVAYEIPRLKLFLRLAGCFLFEWARVSWNWKSDLTFHSGERYYLLKSRSKQNKTMEKRSNPFSTFCLYARVGMVFIFFPVHVKRFTPSGPLKLKTLCMD